MCFFEYLSKCPTNFNSMLCLELVKNSAPVVIPIIVASNSFLHFFASGRIICVHYCVFCVVCQDVEQTFNIVFHILNVDQALNIEGLILMISQCNLLLQIQSNIAHLIHNFALQFSQSIIKKFEVIDFFFAERTR